MGEMTMGKSLMLRTAVLILCSVLFSCATAEQRLRYPVSASQLRLGDIEKTVEDDPVSAIHLLSAYEARYGEEGEEGAQVARLREQALAGLVARLEAAAAASRWDEASSYSRSLAAVLPDSEPLFSEAEAAHEYADSLLAEGKTLQALLLAVRAHKLRPLDGADAASYLKVAAAARQRRTAAFFLSILRDSGYASDDPEYAAAAAFAGGRDHPADMIKGVATVLVDRGIRIEKGRGLPDRVIGSAFFIDSSGLLITNYHVISSEVDPKYEGYSRMYIRMGDSTAPRIPAKVVGWDKALDLAVIKAEITPEYVFSLVGGSVPRVGETIFAIGSPAGLEKTVTSGIVSALGRRFLQIGDVIQIDAAVNHGNSGGPVVDAEGRLVGVVFAGIEAYEGLNFAVPAERLVAALPSMLDGGGAERPWLGITLSEGREGAEIVYVSPLTPAAELALPEGVVILSLNGKKIEAPAGALIPALQDELFPGKPGELVALVTSDGVRRVLKTAPRPALPLSAALKNDSRERLAAPLFGLVLSPAFGKTVSPSYLIKKVVRGSVADEAGLSENDPLSVRGFTFDEEEGYAVIDITVKKRRMGYLETMMRLPAALDTPDTL